MAIRRFFKVLFTLIFFGNFSSCGEYETEEVPEKTLVEKFSITRSADGNRLLASTQLTSFELYSLDESNQAKEKITVNDLVLEAKPGNTQDKFLVRSMQDTFYVAERHISTEGAPNIRDIGGLFTTDGYQVKWGVIFRSGKLGGIKKEDYARLEGLNIRTICDFRSTQEVKDEPDKWPNMKQVNHVKLPIGDTLVSKWAMLKKLRKDDFDATAFMYQANRSFVLDYSESYKTFFQHLLKEENRPILYHCTAGKDRAGLATVFILSALGVDRATIEQDYLLSNYYLHAHTEADLKKAAKYLGIDHQKLRPLMKVKPEYLKGAFDAIEEKYGTMENFLCEALAICEKDIEQLKRMFLYDYE